MGDPRRGVEAQLIGARHVAEQRHADLSIPLIGADRAAEIGDGVAGGAAHLRQKVAVQLLAVLAEIDAEGGADRDGGQLEQVAGRSEEHTSELQSLMRNSYAVFSVKKKTKNQK